MNEDMGEIVGFTVEFDSEKKTYHVVSKYYKIDVNLGHDALMSLRELADQLIDDIESRPAPLPKKYAEEQEEEWAYNDLGHHWRMDDTGSYHDYPCDHPEEHEKKEK